MDTTHEGGAPAARDDREELLLVDNDTRIVELLSWFLTERGFVVRSADSFVRARVLLETRRPDLLVSDVDLGAESALAELPRLAADGLLPRTLVVSGYLDAEVEAALLRIPAVLDTLAKPFEFTDLEAKIAECLARDVASQRTDDLDAPRSEAVVRGAGAGSGNGTSSDEDGWIEITPRA